MNTPEWLTIGIVCFLLGLMCRSAAHRVKEALFRSELERYKDVVVTQDWRTVGELPEDEQRLAVVAVRRAEMQDPDYVKKWSKET